MPVPRSKPLAISGMRSAALLALVVSLTCLSLSAQQNPATSAEVKQSSPSIWISARDKDGRPAQLRASDLEVRINGNPVSVADLHRVGPPLRYCLLLDVSGSQRAFRKTQHDAAVALLSKIPQSGRDYGIVVDFNDQAFLDGEGAEPQKLIKAINQDARGGTALYDAMVAGTGDLSKGPPDADLHLMFMLSDGEDNSSKVARETTDHSLVSARVRFYAIGEKDTGNSSPGTASRGIATLKHFAELTGGKSYLPGKEWALDKIVDDIAADLASVYTLTPALEHFLAGDRFYKLQIKSRSKAVTITSPREYFVPLSNDEAAR